MKIRDYEVSETMLNRARRGAKFLDKVYGSRNKWRKKIKLSKLDLTAGSYFPSSGSCGCVLAQLDANGGAYGFYNKKADELGMEPYGTVAKRRGFTLPALFSSSDWDELTQAWKIVLREKV